MTRVALLLAALLAAAPAFAQTAGTPSEPAPAATASPSASGTPAASTAPLPAGASATGRAAGTAAPAPAEDSAAPRTFNVGVLDDAPPFSSIGRFGVRTGFDIDVALALCSRLEADCNLVPFAAEDIVTALRDRRIDFAVASLSPSDRLANLVDFTRPYVRIAVRFVVPRNPAAARDPAAKPVYAALAGSAEAEDLKRLYTDPGAVRLYANADGMWVDLALGRLNGVLAPAITARRDFLATPIGEGFRFAMPTDGQDFGRVAAIAVRRGDGTLRAALDRALADLIAAPEYGEILSRHLDSDLAGPPAAS